MSNRIVLKINFVINNGIKIDLFHLDPRFLSTDKEFLHFYTSTFDFLIYSRSQMSVTLNSFRLPDKKTYTYKQSVTRNFDSEEERYNFLKGLHNCLLEWNDNFTPFTKDSSHNNRNKNLIMSNEYWII